MGISSVKLTGINSPAVRRIQLIDPSSNITNYNSLQKISLTTLGQYFITFYQNTQCSLKMWGGAGGNNSWVMGTARYGGAGGYSTGTLTFLRNQTYTIWVGQGGAGGGGATGTPTRSAFGGGGKGLWGGGDTNAGDAGGAGLSGIFLGSSASQGNSILIAGGGGGAGYAGNSGVGNLDQAGGAGGGSVGEDGRFAVNSRAGKGGSQSSGGGTGNSDTSGGIQASMSGSALQGGAGFYSYNAGGGGGYFGGGASSHDGSRGGAGGGGGSGYINTSLISNGSTFTGSQSTPYNSGDVDRGNAGSPASSAWASGNNGAVIIIPIGVV